MSFGRRHFFDNQLVAWKRTLRTADYKSERSIDIYTNHRLLVTRENSQWRGVVACGEITNMWFTELNREKAPESSLNSYHENIFQHFLRSHPMMTLLNLFFLLPNVLLQKNNISGEKRGRRRKSSHRLWYVESPREFFFNLRQKQESVSSFFYFLLPSYTLYTFILSKLAPTFFAVSCRYSLQFFTPSPNQHCSITRARYNKCISAYQPHVTWVGQARHHIPVAKHTLR